MQGWGMAGAMEDPRNHLVLPYHALGGTQNSQKANFYVIIMHGQQMML